MIPRLMPWSSSPAPGATRTANRSTMPATATSDWPTPTVSTITTSKPAASQSSIASRVRRATPPRVPAVAEDRAGRARAGRVDGEDGNTVTVLDEMEAERLDERGLPRSRRARDPDADGAARVREHLGEQRGCLLAMVGPGR